MKKNALFFENFDPPPDPRFPPVSQLWHPVRGGGIPDFGGYPPKCPRFPRPDGGGIEQLSGVPRQTLNSCQTSPRPEGVSFATFGGTPKVPQVPLKLTLSGGGKFAYFRGIPPGSPARPSIPRLSDPSDGAELPFGPESAKVGVQKSTNL